MHIDGYLVIPNNTIGTLVFAHGSDSSKSSKRNQPVSGKLNKSNIETLLFDLLTDEEPNDTQLEKMSFKIPGAILNKFNNIITNKQTSDGYRLGKGKSHYKKITDKLFCFNHRRDRCLNMCN